MVGSTRFCSVPYVDTTHLFWLAPRFGARHNSNNHDHIHSIENTNNIIDNSNNNSKPKQIETNRNEA